MRPQFLLPLTTYPDANGDAVAANGVAVAARFGADLHALALEADIPPVSNALSRVLLDVPEMIRDAESLSARRGAHLLARVEEAAAASGVTLTRETAAAGIALLGDLAATRARYFDLALLGWETNNPTSRATAEAVVFGSGRPALLMPDWHRIDAIDSIAIAWDGSRVAARAVADAAPFVQRAKSITVLTVVDEKPLGESQLGEMLAAGLVRRGLPARASGAEAQGRDIGTVLQEQAIAAGAQVLVMGGYGHSRIRDFVLGGATEGVLGDLRLPVLFSH